MGIGVLGFGSLGFGVSEFRVYIARTKVLTYWTFRVLRHPAEQRSTDKCDLRGLASGIFYTPF